MANISVLANELLTSIIGSLRDRKIDHFDPVATKDLQTIRLVCSKLSAIATPMLFENMILDLKFWRVEDVDKMVHFVATSPELANHVHRLQFRVPSMTTYSKLTGSSCFKKREDRSRLSKALEVYRALEHHDSSIIRMDEAGENAVGSSQQRRAYQTARTSVAALVWEHSREMLALLPNKTLASLPNLFHVENAMSTYHRKHLTETEARSADYNSIDFLDLYEKPEEAQTLALLKGVRGIQSLGIDSLTAETITSWKLREAVAFDGFTMNPPEHLQHLDLEIRILGLGPISPLATALGWRGMLETLSELKSLRLAFACGGGRYADEENSDGHSWMDSDTFYIDYLLIDPCDSDSDSAGLVFFPRLRSLRLVNCALRVQGLQTIAMRHSATLKELELSRVTFDPLYCVGSWSEIGAMCHEALPNLTRLRLAKLITYLPTPRLEGEPEKSPVPNSWNRGLEGATSYEWIKNGRGSGADLEIIGPRCPWHK